MAKFKYGEIVVGPSGEAKVVSISLVSNTSPHTFSSGGASKVKFRYEIEYTTSKVRVSVEEDKLYSKGTRTGSAANGQGYYFNNNNSSYLDLNEKEEEEEEELELEFKKSFAKYDNDTSCPKCGTKWHVAESPFRGKKEIWYTCNNCNQKREDIKKEIDKKDNQDSKQRMFDYGF